MTQGELNLYRNTFEAGRRAGMQDLAEKIGKYIERTYEDTDFIKRKYILQIIDKHLKEALDE